MSETAEKKREGVTRPHRTEAKEPPTHLLQERAGGLTRQRVTVGDVRTVPHRPTPVVTSSEEKGKILLKTSERSDHPGTTDVNGYRERKIKTPLRRQP